MELKVFTRNVRRAKSSSPVWNIITKADADIVTLQVVSSMPGYIREAYSVHERKAVKKKRKGTEIQHCCTWKGEDQGDKAAIRSGVGKQEAGALQEKLSSMLRWP